MNNNEALMGSSSPGSKKKTLGTSPDGAKENKDDIMRAMKSLTEKSATLM